MGLKNVAESGLSGVKNILAVLSGKGGVGKSTTSVNIAAALAEMGHRVGLLDADIYGPSLKLMLGCHETPKSEEGWILPVSVGPHSIQLMSLALFKQGESANAVRAPIANSIISQFVNEVKWGDLDTLIVDFPPGTGDIQLTLMQQVQFSAALFVSTPQKVAVIDVKKSLEMVQSMELPICGVVENMSFLQGHENQTLFGPSHVGDLDLKILAKIPLDPLLSESGDRGESIYSVAPESPICRQFLNLAIEVDRYFAEGEKIEQLFTEIKLRDEYTLELEHNDREKKKTLIPIEKLQKACPCARCASLKRHVDNEVKAKAFWPVGRYAIKVDFSSGCQNGIFSYRMMQDLGER